MDYDANFYNAITNRAAMRKAGQHFKRFIDGEEVGKDPLINIPKPKMVLYGTSIFSSCSFFTLGGLEDFLAEQGKELKEYYVLEYLGDMAGREDVIRVTYIDERGERVSYYTPTSTEHYGKYDHERSVYRGEHVWEGHDGSFLERYFDVLKEHGLEMKNDYWEQEAALIDAMREWVQEELTSY